ncbi:response regulator [Candidatus Margulisiibacteriota bacterium]
MLGQSELISIFKAETEDYLVRLENGFVNLEKDPNNQEILTQLNREAHTIKGSARVYGYNDIQAIAHDMESVLEKVGKKKIKLTAKAMDQLFGGIDKIRKLLGKLLTGPSARPLSEAEGPLGHRVSSPSGAEGSKVEGLLVHREEAVIINEVETRENQHLISKRNVDLSKQFIKVPLNRINKLINLVGEIVINKMKSSQKINQSKRLTSLSKQALKKFLDMGDYIKTNIDDSELRKQFTEGLKYIIEIKDNFQVLNNSITTEVFQLDQVINELQNEVKEIRMLPCSTIFDTFPRMIRDIATQKNKEVKLDIVGAETEIDNKVLEVIKTPMMHLLRNCVDHGIELPDKRVKVNKPKTGTIKLNAYHKAGNVVIEIEDDGRGLDLEEIKKTMVEKRFATKSEVKLMKESEVLNMIFMPGFSTTSEVTDISGRGVGLDIVKKEIDGLKGQIIVDSKKNKGSKFSLVLPLTIAIIQALLVKTQKMLFAVPMSSIEESIKIQDAEIDTLEGKMNIQVRNNTVPIVRLDEILELPIMEESIEETAEHHVVIINSMNKRIGFIVDQIIGEEEIFIKNLGNHLGKIKNISGATILGTGKVVLILDVIDLIEQSSKNHEIFTRAKGIEDIVIKENKILIVEDALSTRELEKSILEAHGYGVVTALDGLDALNKLSKEKFDLIIADINMARMDGFQFCELLKKNSGYKDIPVIIITTRDSEADKRRGMEVGASAYIVKGAFNQDVLLNTIERFIK